MAASSTAELIPVSAPDEIGRRRRQEIIWYLRATIDPDEAMAMASPGYRFLPCGGCGRMACEWCKQEPTEQVRGSGGRRASADPRFVTTILSRLSLVDPTILARAMPAVSKLPPDERWVLLLELGAGWGQQQIADRLKVSRQTVSRLRDRALDHLVQAVWG